MDQCGNASGPEVEFTRHRSLASQSRRAGTINVTRSITRFWTRLRAFVRRPRITRLWTGLRVKPPARQLTLILLANTERASSAFMLGNGDPLRSAFVTAFLDGFVRGAYGVSSRIVIVPQDQRPPCL
jgi:hypothetical protein